MALTFDGWKFREQREAVNDWLILLLLIGVGSGGVIFLLWLGLTGWRALVRWGGR